MNSNIIKIEDPFPYLIVENLYNEDELKLIWQELEFLNHPCKLELPENIGGALEDFELISNNRGLFLDDLYKKREISNILTVNRKIFTDSYFNAYASLNFSYKSLKYTNFDRTLLSYYEHGNYYKPHSDNSVHTILTWFYKEPKAFFGGDLYFPEYKHYIKIKNNMTVIFPGFISHEVDKVRMKDNSLSGYGRYCMTQFTTYV